MNRIRAVGVLVTVLALVGYVFGVETAYPGRALTLTGLMVGVTLVAMSGGWR